MTGDVTGSELAEVYQQSHMSVMGRNMTVPSPVQMHWVYWDGCLTLAPLPSAMVVSLAGMLGWLACEDLVLSVSILDSGLMGAGLLSDGLGETSI